MMRRVWALLLPLVLFGQSASAQSPEATRGVVPYAGKVEQADPNLRMALVIGNSAYPVGNLSNETRRGCHDHVLRLGFKVKELVDADRASMVKDSRNSERSPSRAYTILVYYAGHVQMEGELYDPLDADMKQEDRSVQFHQSAGLARRLGKRAACRSGGHPRRMSRQPVREVRAVPAV
jgi:hypothetical protein